MWRLPLDFHGVLHVAENMRQADRDEIFATMWEDSPTDLAHRAMSCGPFSWLCGKGKDPTPIVALGAFPMYPGAWSVWMFATEEIRHIRHSLTRFAKRDMMAALLKSGGRRAECRSIEGHTDAQAWLGFLGFFREATHRGVGKNGETFHTYAWVLNDVHVNPAGQ